MRDAALVMSKPCPAGPAPALGDVADASDADAGGATPPAMEAIASGVADSLGGAG